MIPKSVQKFVDLIKVELGSNLVTIVLVGSFSRGEETESSDIDLCVLVHDINIELMHVIGRVTGSILSKNEINPAVVSVSELRSNPDLFEIHKLHYDGIVLYGQLPDDIKAEESELVLAKRIARDVLMSSRHYLAVSEPASNFERGKLWFWNLKPLSFALRYYHVHKTGCYVRRFEELAILYPVLNFDPVADYEKVIIECIDMCQEIINA